MKNWIKRTFVALFGAGVLAGGLAACSHGPRGFSASGDGDRTEWRGRMLERVAGKLELNDAQKLKLDALATRLQEQRQAFVGDAADPRAEMRKLIAGSTFDKAGAQALVDQKIAAVRGKSPDVITAMADFYDSLTPEQQQRVRDFTQRRHGWRRHG